MMEGNSLKCIGFPNLYVISHVAERVLKYGSVIELVKYFIAGIDPGTHTAIVLISLRGELIDFIVEKGLGEEGAVRYIISKGTPSLIATDVSPPPKFVVKVSAMLNIPLYYPERSLKKGEKEKLAKHIANPHVRDAYAAARKAYNTFANRLRNLEKKNGSEEAKHNFLRGRRIYDNALTNRAKRRFKKHH